MVYRNLFNRAQLRIRVPTRVLGALKESSKKHSRKLRTGLALIAALALGFLAESGSRSASLWDWEVHHGPSRIIWSGALSTYGFHGTTDATLLQKISRSLPSRSVASPPGPPQVPGRSPGRDEEEQQDSPPGAGWISNDANWIVLLDDPFAAYCRSCDETPSSWQPMESGWRGFEKVLLTASQQKPKVVSTGPKRVVRVSDPRQIHY